MTTDRNRALKALYGARSHGHTRTHPETVKTLIGPGERPQEICTPAEVLDPLREVWGGITLDPCGHVDSLVQAETTWHGMQVPTGRVRKDGSQVLEWTGPGNRKAWRDRTFWNPPYSDLKAWIAHARGQRVENLGLFPARSNRVWWRAYMCEVDAICWLDPLKFFGYKQTFPAALVLAYRGPRPADMALAMAHLGTWTGPLQPL